MSNATLTNDLLNAFDKVSGGVHPGFRPAHAKGTMYAGTFTPSVEAKALTRAPHIANPSTQVTVRFSVSTGIPNLPDNDTEHAPPQGMAVRFHLGEHVHTDIVAHSHNGFPVRTGEEFLEFLRAIAASGPDAPPPPPIVAFLTKHPTAMAFVNAPKPIPASYARQAYFAVTAFKFINQDGKSAFGRFRFQPAAGVEFLSDEEAKKKSADFLSQELAERLATGPVQFSVTVQLAEEGDIVADATAVWPETRREAAFGMIELTKVIDEMGLENRKIIFDPLPRVDGIETAGDPLTEVRSELYLLSGRRRRKVT